MALVMLVEDNPDETLIFQHACPKAGLHVPFIFMENALEAIEYLSDSGKPKPCLLITDLNMPRKNGFELLAWLRQTGQENAFPVVVLTASADPGDKEKVLGLGAVDFLTKPGGFDELVQTLRGVRTKWIDPHCATQALADRDRR